MEKDFLQLAATDVFRQAEDGLAVPVDPELAEILGAEPQE